MIAPGIDAGQNEFGTKRYRRSRRRRTVNELTLFQPHAVSQFDNRSKLVSGVRARGAQTGLGIARFVKIDETRLQAVSDRQQRRIAHAEFAIFQRHRRLGMRASLRKGHRISGVLVEKSTTDEIRRGLSLICKASRIEGLTVAVPLARETGRRVRPASASFDN